MKVSTMVEMCMWAERVALDGLPNVLANIQNEPTEAQVLFLVVFVRCYSSAQPSVCTSDEWLQFLSRKNIREFLFGIEV